MRQDERSRASFLRSLILCLLLLTPMAAAAGIGVFADVQGDTRILRGEVYLAAAPGVDVEEDDIIETGNKASAQVEMNDGTLLKLGASSRLLLADYKFDSSGKVVNAGLEVLSGWLRFAVSKLRSKESRYAINTPTMTIGIRGTEGVIEAQTARGGLLLDEGEVAVHAVNSGSVPVRAGEYIERASGQPFVRPKTVPSAFRSRMPLNMQARMERRALMLKRRGVRAQQIRQIQQDDRARYIRQHPHLRERLEQRFRGHTGSTTGPRANLRERRQQQMQQNQGQPVRRPSPAGDATNRP